MKPDIDHIMGLDEDLDAGGTDRQDEHGMNMEECAMDIIDAVHARDHKGLHRAMSNYMDMHKSPGPDTSMTEAIPKE